MKSLFLPFAVGVAACVLALSAFGDEAKDVLARSVQAQLAAPTCRMTINTKEADTGKTSVVVVETVSPGQMHVREERGGKVRMEMFTDGRRTMLRRGADGPVIQAPANIGAMIGNFRSATSLQALAAAAKDVKVVGHDVVDGQTATIYTFTADTMGVHANSKLWVSDKDALPLKAEADSTGSPDLDLAGSDGKTSRHSVITFNYDPGITVALPAA